MKHNHRWTRWVTPSEARTLGWYAAPFTKWTRRCVVGGCGTIISRMDDPAPIRDYVQSPHWDPRG